MSGNGWGEVNVNSTAEMRRYDNLEPDVRALLQRMIADWEVNSVARLCRQAFAYSDERADAIAVVERYLAMEEAGETYRTYGPSHPQARQFLGDDGPDEHRLWGQAA